MIDTNVVPKQGNVFSNGCNEHGDNLGEFIGFVTY
jgi:hypothetical protein